MKDAFERFCSRFLSSVILGEKVPRGCDRIGTGFLRKFISYLEIKYLTPKVHYPTSETKPFSVLTRNFCLSAKILKQGKRIRQDVIIPVTLRFGKPTATLSISSAENGTDFLGFH